MNPKERLARAMALEAVDRPPCICPGGMMNMVTRELMEARGTFWPEAHADAAMMADLSAAASELKCFENYGLPFCMTVEVEGMGATVDMGSAVYEPHVVGYAVGSVTEWERLARLDTSAGRAKVVLDAIAILRERGDDVPIIGNLTGPVSVASSLMEPTVFYKELRKKRDESHAFMAFVAEQLLAFGRAQLEAGADMIAISDPSGTGEILGPKLFGEFAVPYLNRVVNGLKEAKPGVEVIVHICGKMHNVYEPLREIACSTLSFDALVNMREARAELPGKALMGNVSTYTLEFGDPQKVSSITENCMRLGVDIVAPACGMGNASPLANIQAILRTVEEVSAANG